MHICAHCSYTASVGGTIDAAATAHGPLTTLGSLHSIHCWTTYYPLLNPAPRLAVLTTTPATPLLLCFV